MISQAIPGGTVHQLPDDLRKALSRNSCAQVMWEDITPLARNEWICWVTSVKRTETRAEHVKRVVEELEAGKRRPCCWIGCVHRKDKKMSRSQKYILSKNK